MLKHQFRNIAFIIFMMIILSFIFYSPASAQGGEKVAVLYFTDHSNFDTGGCCLLVWPLDIIFGGKNKDKWDLKIGFRSLLNEKLTEAGYSIIEQDYVDRSLQETGSENLAALADKLDADIMITGDIRKFQMHRLHAGSQAPNTLDIGRSGQSDQIGDTRMAAVVGVDGYYYSSSVETDITIYDGSGSELEHTKISSKKDLQDVNYGMGLGVRNKQEGSSPEQTIDSRDVAVTMTPINRSLRTGDATKADEVLNPQDIIVDYKTLDEMKFGTDEFKNKTLFGIATMDVMDKIMTKVSEHLGPSQLARIEGKIIYVGTGGSIKENEVYINLGAADGIKPGIKLSVYTGDIQLTDPDTGKELGKVAGEKMGVIKVSKVEADHLSLAEIVERIGQIERENIVRRE